MTLEDYKKEYLLTVLDDKIVIKKETFGFTFFPIRPEDEVELVDLSTFEKIINELYLFDENNNVIYFDSIEEKNDYIRNTDNKILI